MFLITGLGSNVGVGKLFKKKYLSKFFGAKMNKTLVIMSQKLLYR